LGKKQNIETILSNAEKFFQRENYPLAIKEFQKAQKKINSEDVAEKINICRNKIAVSKAKNFVKLGHKAVKKSDLQKALTCFKDAQKHLNEEWLSKKISEIEDTLSNQNTQLDAKQAEKTNDFIKAAALYLKSAKASNNVLLLQKSACCMVKAKKYSDAADLFKTLVLTDQNAIYDYGFSLAKSGKFIEGLTVWQNLKTSEISFIEQKKQLLYLACSDIYNKLANKPDFTLIIKDTDCILKEAVNLNCKNLISIIEKLHKYCKYSLIEQLWEAEDYKAIELLIKTIDSINSPYLLALCAKTYFHLAQKESKYLKPMMTFWFTAIYSKEITAQFSTGISNEQTNHKEKVQKKLIQSVESLLNKQINTTDGEQATIYLEIEKKLINDLLSLVKQNKDNTDFICMPSYAAEFGLSDKILKLIKENRAYFQNQKHFLETGGYYSKAWKSLYAVKTYEFKKALTIMDKLDAKTKEDPFINYISNVVHFEYGKYCVENNKKDYLKYFDTASELFQMAPIYGKKFTEKILQIDDKKLGPYEQILTSIYHKTSDSYLIAQTLSTVMARFVFQKTYNSNLPYKGMKGVLVKALQIDPHNELVHTFMKKLSMMQEHEAIDLAISKNKLAKAVKIVLNSEYSEAEDWYFECINSILDQYDELDLENNYDQIILQEIYDWSTHISTDHDVINRVNHMINRNLANESL